MLLRRGALLLFKVIRQISRSHDSKIVDFDPIRAFPDCNQVVADVRFSNVDKFSNVFKSSNDRP